MKYSIIYSSKTGNTEKLADNIKKTLSQDECIYFGVPSSEAACADIIFAGFWTDKGSCDESVAKFLQGLSQKNVFLFGTAGFGRSESYYSKILDNVKKNLSKTCTVIGTFMCQGKMQPSVRARYEGMMEENLETAKELIANFDEALKHPDIHDLEMLTATIQKLS